MSTTSQASQRINALLDENSFVEIGGLVTARATDFNLKQTETPSDGVVTGYGLIDGNLVYVYSQDASVLNGSVGEMHAKKIVNIYELAMKMGARRWTCPDSCHDRFRIYGEGEGEAVCQFSQCAGGERDFPLRYFRRCVPERGDRPGGYGCG